MLLNRGGNVYALDDSQSTALIRTLVPNTNPAKKIKVVELLLKAGSDPNHKNKFGKTAYDYARENIRSNSQEFIDLLTSYDSKKYDAGY